MRISDWSSDVCSSDLLALLVGDALRQRLGRFENERIRPRRQLLEQAELAIVDACVSGDLGQVATDQRELVMAVEITNAAQAVGRIRSEEHTSELQSLMRISYAVFCLKKKKYVTTVIKTQYQH